MVPCTIFWCETMSGSVSKNMRNCVNGVTRPLAPLTPAQGVTGDESAGEKKKKATEKQKKYIMSLIPKILEKYQEALKLAEEYRRQGLSLLPTLARDELIAKIAIRIAEMVKEDTLDVETASYAIEFLKNPAYSLLGRYEKWLKLLK